MQPKNPAKSFLYSKLIKPPPIQLFGSAKRIQEEKDICDAISTILCDQSSDYESENKLNLKPAMNIKNKESFESLDLILSSELQEEDNITFIPNRLTLPPGIENNNGKMEMSMQKKHQANVRDNYNSEEKVETKVNEEIPPVVKKESEFTVENFKFNFKKPEINFVAPNFTSILKKDSTTVENKVSVENSPKKLSEIPNLIQNIIEENNKYKLNENSLEAEINSLKLKFEISENTVREIKQEKAIILNNLEVLKKESYDLNSKLKQNENDKISIQGYLRNIQTEIEEYKNNKLKKENEINNLLDCKNELECKIINYEKNALLSYKRVCELEDKIKCQENSLNNLEIEKEEYKNKTQEFKQQIVHLKCDIENEKNKKEKYINSILLKKQELYNKLEAIELKIKYGNITEESNILQIDNIIESIENKKTMVSNLNVVLNRIKQFVLSNNNLYVVKKKELVIIKELQENCRVFLNSFIGFSNSYKIKQMLIPTLIELRNNLQEIQYIYLKEKTQNSYLIEDLQTRHKNEIENLRSVYSSQIKKIIKHYKGKNIPNKQLIPHDEDVWNVFK